MLRPRPCPCLRACVPVSLVFSRTHFCSVGPAAAVPEMKHRLRTGLCAPRRRWRASSMSRGAGARTLDGSAPSCGACPSSSPYSSALLPLAGPALSSCALLYIATSLSRCSVLSAGARRSLCLSLCACVCVRGDGVSSKDASLGFVRSCGSVWNKLPRLSVR